MFQAYQYTTISSATLSYYFAPVLVSLASPLLFHEQLTRRQVLCFACSTLGLLLIVVPDGTQGGANLTGVLYELGAAAFYACVILLNKAIRTVAGLHRTLIQFAAAAAVLLPYVLCTGGVHLDALDETGWGCLLLVGLVHTGASYCLYFSSLKGLSGQQAAILSYIDPLAAVLISVLALGESMMPLQGIGGALILGFTLWNELGPERA